MSFYADYGSGEPQGWGYWCSSDMMAEHLELDKNLDLVPHGGTLLDLGSGIALSLEAQIFLKRPDIKVIALDPGYALRNYDEDARDIRDFMVDELGQEQQEKLRATAEWTGRLVAGSAEALPLADESVDMIVSHAAVPEYCFNAAPALRESLRVLKSGSRSVNGPMHDTQFRYWDLAIKDAVREGQIVNYNPELKEVFSREENNIFSLTTFTKA